jgi:hypothetical protein
MIFVMSSEVETSLDAFFQKIIRDSSTALRFARNDNGQQETFIEVLKAQ